MTWKWMPYCAAFAVVPVLGACDPGETPDQDRPQEPAQVTRPGPTPLMPIDHSGVTGTARADERNGDVRIRLSFEGLDPGATYLASVHGDRCAADGPVRIPLGRITGGDDGTADVELRAEDHEMPELQPWSVHVQTEEGQTVACADFDGE